MYVWVQDMGLGLCEGPVCEIAASEIERGNPRFHFSCLQCVPSLDKSYRVARKICGSFILRIRDFLWFAGTNFCGSR